MDTLQLILPDSRYADEIWAYRAEMLESGSSMDGCSSLKCAESAQQWIDKVRAREKQENCPGSIVASHQYLAVRVCDGRLVGMLQLRHHIDHPVLSAYGGHIGYSVRPGERRKGYATEMLRLALELYRKRGLSRVMVSCHEGNLGSEKVIRKNGGVYEAAVDAGGRMVKRFWITL